MLLPTLDKLIRGGDLSRWVHEIRTTDEIWDEPEPTWSVDDATGEVVRKGGYVVVDKSPNSPTPQKVDRLVAERLRSTPSEALRAFQARAAEHPGDVRAIADLFLAEIDALLELVTQSPSLKTIPSAASALREAASSIRRAAGIDGQQNRPSTSTGTASSRKKRVGNPNMTSRLDAEQKAQLYDDWVEMREASPEEYEPRTPGNVSDNAKNELAARYGVSPSTVKRAIESEKDRRRM